MTLLKRAALLFALTSAGCGLAVSDQERLDRAELAISEGDYRAAIIDLKDVLRRDPDNVEARLLLGDASLEVGDPAAAEKELRRAVDLGVPLQDVIVDLGNSLLEQGRFQEVLDEFPSDADIDEASRSEWMLVRAQALLGLQDYTSARDAFTALLSRDSDNVAAKLGVVSTYLGERNEAQARSTLDEVLAAHPDAADAWLASGELNFRINRIEDAASNFRMALELLGSEDGTTAQIRGLVGLAEAQFALNEHDAARESIQQLETIAPQATSTLLLSARLSYLDKDLNAAQQKLQQVLQRAPNFIAAKMLLGVVHLESGNLSQAEMYLSSVVANAPENPEARTLLAETRLQLRRLDLASETLTPMLSGSTQDPRALFVAGRLSMQSGDIDEGVRYLEQSVAASPGNAELKFQLAVAYIAAGRVGDARTLLDEIEQSSNLDDDYRRGLLTAMADFRDGDVQTAIASAKAVAKKYPERSEINNLIGYFYVTENDADTARQYFERSASQPGGDIVSQRMLASLDIADNRIEDAKSRYTAILEMRPEDTWAMLALARIAGESEDLELAVEWLEKARSSDPSSLEARVLLARQYLRQGSNREAEQVALEAVSLDASNAVVHNMLGVALLKQAKFGAATDSFSAAIDRDSENPEYRRNLAMAQSGLNQPEAAAETLQSAWDQGIADVPTTGMLISTKINERDFTAALAIARKLRQLHPESQAAVAYEGEVHLASGDADQAIRVYDEALAMGANRNVALRAYRILENQGKESPLRPLIDYLDVRPLDAVARMILAQAHQRKGDRSEAIKEYEKVLEVEPENAVVLNNLAWLYHEVGDSKAAKTARMAYELRPDFAPIVDTLGWILVQNGDVDEGVRLLSNAVSIDTDSAEYKYHLAAGLAKQGETERARRALVEILEGGQDFASRRDAEELLGSL